MSARRLLMFLRPWSQRDVSVMIILVLRLAFLSVAAQADDTSFPSTPQIEPIEFASTATMQTEPAGPGSALSQWSFAVFSPDSKWIAAVSQPESEGAHAGVVVWDVAELKLRCHYSQPSRIVAIQFSPDGALLAIGPSGPQSAVILIDALTGAVKATLSGPANRTNCLAWSRNGDRLALGSSFDKSVREWDVAKKKFVRAYEVELSSVFGVTYLMDGTLLAVGSPTRDRVLLHVLDVAAGKTVQTLTGHRETIDAAEFSANAAQIASAGWDASVRTWDAANGEAMAELKGHKRGVNTVSISADGRRLVSANSREFKLWDGEKKEQLADLGAEAKFVTMAPNGEWLIAISRDGTARLWDVEKKTEKTTLTRTAVSPKTETKSDQTADKSTPGPPPGDVPESEAIQALAYSPNGKWLAIAREDGRISIRTAIDGKLHRELEAFGDVASSVSFSPDCQFLAAGSFEKLIKIWNVETGHQVAELAGHKNWVFGVAFSSDGQTLASASYDRSVKLWNVAAAREIATLTGHTAGVRTVAFAKDGKHLISGGSDRTAIVWSLADHQIVATLKGHTAAVRDIAFSPDGGTVATASEDSTIKLWRTSDWTERGVAKGTDGVMFWCVTFSPQGRTLAAGAFDGAVKLFDPSDGKERVTLAGATDAITSVAFAPDTHEIIASSIDKSFRRWRAIQSAPSTTSTGETKAPELKSAEAITALNATTLKTEHPVCSLTFAASGKLLVVGTGAYRVAGNLQLWDVVKRERKWQSAEFKFGIPGIAVSPNGQQIAMGNFADNFLRVYSAADGEKLKEIRGHRSKVHGVAYSPNGKLLATASLDRDIKLWDAATNRDLKTFVGHKDFALSIEFSPDGKKLLTASADHSVKLWDLESGIETRSLSGLTTLVQQATFSKDGSRIATAGGDGMARVYDTSSGDYLFTLRGHRNKIESVAYAPNGKLIATASSDRTIRLWDATCGAELLKLSQEGNIRAVQFSPDGKRLASGCDDKTVKLWDVSAIRQ